MLFAVTPMVTVFCLVPSPHPQKKITEGSGDLTGGAEGPSPADSDVCLQSSHSKTGDLYVSNFLSQRVSEQKIYQCEEVPS